MRSLIELARFFRPSFTGQKKTTLSYVALKYFSSSTKCTNTTDDSGSSPKLEFLKSSQNLSTAKVETKSEQRTTYPRRTTIPWSADDYRKLIEAHENGMTTKAITLLFPAKTYSAVKAKLGALLSSPSMLDEHQPGHERRRCKIRWQPAEIELLHKLHKDGAPIARICAHFPARSALAVESAVHRFVVKPPVASIRIGPWSWEDTRYLTESALQGANLHEIAKVLGRTSKAIQTRARRIGVQFVLHYTEVTTEEKEQIVNMRTDGATFATIAAAIGRKVSTTRRHWNYNRPGNDKDTKLRRRDLYPPTQLTIDDHQIIESMRDQAASWSSIGSLYSQYQLGSIKQDFWRFTNRRLSLADMRTIQSLRQKGKLWREISDTGDYPFFTDSGLRKAYARALRKKAAP